MTNWNDWLKPWSESQEGILNHQSAIFEKYMEEAKESVVMQAGIRHTKKLLMSSAIWCWNTTVFEDFDVWGMTPLIADCLLVPR